MNRTVESKNKALVLEAFDTLFNKRDYAAAERYWSPNYIQHSAHIEPGRDGLFNLIKSIPPTLKRRHPADRNPRDEACNLSFVNYATIATSLGSNASASASSMDLTA